LKTSSILVVNMNYLGDALMTTPAIRALKMSFENVSIDVIAGSTANYGALEILALDPDIDLLIPRVDGGSIARGKQLYQVARAKFYDLIVVLPSLPFYSAIAKMSGSQVFTVPKADESKHMADHMLECVASYLHLAELDRSMVMRVPGEVQSTIKNLLGPVGAVRKLIAFNLGASRPQKRWPSGHFAEAAKLVIGAGFDIVLLGGDNDQDLAAATIVMSSVDDLNKPGTAVDLVGKTTLEQLSAVIDFAAVLLTADTGAMHIASALETPVLALFGSTSACFTGPYGGRGRTIVLDLHLSCAPCITHPTCNGRYDCMVGILPEMVLKSILKLLTVREEIAACVGK
jgi:lipopolysaccharide heptosyltransferase II